MRQVGLHHQSVEQRDEFDGFGRASNHARRVVEGQRLMQAASDIFLGWTRGPAGRDFYFRQLRDMKISVEIEEMSLERLENYARLCGWGLALAHAEKGRHLITAKTEHHAVLHAFKALGKSGDFDVTFLDVDGKGVIDPDDLAGAIRADTTLVSIMSAPSSSFGMNSVPRNATEPMAARESAAAVPMTTTRCVSAHSRVR